MHRQPVSGSLAMGLLVCLNIAVVGLLDGTRVLPASGLLADAAGIVLLSLGFYVGTIVYEVISHVGPDTRWKVAGWMLPRSRWGRYAALTLIVGVGGLLAWVVIVWLFWWIAFFISFGFQQQSQVDNLFNVATLSALGLGGFLLFGAGSIILGFVLGLLILPGLEAFANVGPYLAEMRRPVLGFALSYLAIIIVFAGWFWLMDTMQPSSLCNGDCTASHSSSRFSDGDFLFFSLKNIAPLDQSDIHAQSDAAKSLASAEFLVGVLWGVVLFPAVLAYLDKRFKAIAEANSAQSGSNAQADTDIEALLIRVRRHAGLLTAGFPVLVIAIIAFFLVPSASSLFNSLDTSSGSSHFRLGYTNGQYFIKVLDQHAQAGGYEFLDQFGAARNTRMTISARLVQGRPSVYPQMGCRDRTAGNQEVDYELDVYPTTGRFQVWRDFDPHAKRLGRVAFSRFIDRSNRGRAWNSLTMTCEGNTIAGEVNGHRLFSVHDALHASGKLWFGLYWDGKWPGVEEALYRNVEAQRV
jgi:hypothetical protein